MCLPDISSKNDFEHLIIWNFRSIFLFYRTVEFFCVLWPITHFIFIPAALLYLFYKTWRSRKNMITMLIYIIHHFSDWLQHERTMNSCYNLYIFWPKILHIKIMRNFMLFSIPHTYQCLRHRWYFKCKYIICLDFCQALPNITWNYKWQIIAGKTNRVISSRSQRNSYNFYAIPFLRSFMRQIIFSLWIIWNSCQYRYLISSFYPFWTNIIDSKWFWIKILTYY